MSRLRQPAGQAAAPGPLRASLEPRAQPGSRALDLGVAIALGAMLALALTTVAFALARLFVSHSETFEDAEWLAGVVLVPSLATFLAGRVLRAGDSPARRATLAVAAPAVLLAGCTAMLVAHIADALPGQPLSLGWWLLLVLVPPLALLAARPAALGAATARAAARVPAGRGAVAAAAVVASAGAIGVAAFVPMSSHGPFALGLALILLLPALEAYRLLHGRTYGRRAQLAVALAVPVVLALLAWDVSFQPLPSHQDFYLGPVNDVLHGRYMLVDDYSQYGVGVIYFLAALFAPLPLGYGAFVLVLGALTACLFSTIYVVLRVATRSGAFAGLGTFVALMASTIATLGRSTEFPSTGFLRFGIPWLLVCALVLAYRDDRPRRVPLLLAYALVGVAAIWSIETAVYTFTTFAVAVIAVAATGADGNRVRSALAHLAAGAAAAVLAIAVLVVATEIGRGVAPHPVGYFDFLALYSVDGFGQLPVPGWSLGYLMGALYAVSLTGVAAILIYARGSALARPSAIVPLAAVTAFGAISLTYFVGRSHPNNLTHVAPPFVAMITLWAAVAWRTWPRGRHPVATAGVALTAVCAALLCAQQLPLLAHKAPDSALAAVARSAEGDQGLLADLRVLTRNPVVDPRARAVAALVRRNVPPSSPLLVAVEPTVASEALIRLDRSDAVPIGAAEQDSLLRERRALLIREAGRLRCGLYVVTQDARIAMPQGRLLFSGMLAALHSRHAFRQVAAGSGYRVFRLPCGTT